MGTFHGTAFWNAGNSILDAAPFVLAGDSVPNPAYYSNNYGLMDGLCTISAWVHEAKQKRFIQLSYSGQSTSSLVNNYGLVPTDLERQGNFSQLTNSDGSLIPIYPPGVSLRIPTTRSTRLSTQRRLHCCTTFRGQTSTAQG